MGAGLPDFKGLVSHCYTELGAVPPASSSDEWQWLDRMLGSLENRFGSDAMRDRVAERLDRVASDLRLHESILKLARLKGPAAGYRLVTTNFDLFFEQAKAGLTLGRDYHSGPVLPIPRNDQTASWRSIVYLHGRLDIDGGNNQHLVLTSADFGRAYLTEGWAARFVARLFAEFTVLFIGYSLNDPVLRYMTDAFAAEDALSRSGRKRDPAYIFVSHAGLTPPDPTPYRDRRLEPIFYREAFRHRALQRTLVEWADAREDYLTRVRQIIHRTAPRLPSALEPSDLSNAIWAIAGRDGDGGQGAKTFRELDPSPPVEWLAEFERRDNEIKNRHDADVSEALSEGREPPSPPQLHVEPLFPSRFEVIGAPTISDTSFQLMRWFAANLDRQKLVDWMIAKARVGRRPHSRLRFFIRQRLDQEPLLPAGYALFWRVIAAEGGWASNQDFGFPPNDLRTPFTRTRDAAWLSQELRAALRPYLVFSPSYRAMAASDQPVDPEKIGHIADAEVKLSAENLSLLLEWINATPAPNDFWANRLEMLTDRLRQVFDLYDVVGEASASYDPSVFQRPSIVPHAQNRHHAGWSVLFDLIWRGWTVVDTRDAQSSRHWIDRWRRIPYLGFQRLALAATAHSPHMTAAEKLEALLNG